MPSDYAEQIKDSVTMLDIARMYGLNVNRASKAICPFHPDRKPSMHIYPGRKGWYCFVCGQGGDVIRFVMMMFGLSFQDAVAKINDDFRLGLPIGDCLSDEDRKEADRIAYQRRMEMKRKKERAEACIKDYHSALDEYIALDTAMRENAPRTPYDAITEEYASACRSVAAAEYRLDLAEMKMMKEEI